MNFGYLETFAALTRLLEETQRWMELVDIKREAELVMDKARLDAILTKLEALCATQLGDAARAEAFAQHRRALAGSR